MSTSKKRIRLNTLFRTKNEFLKYLYTYIIYMIQSFISGYTSR